MLELTTEELKQYFKDDIFRHISAVADGLGVECYVVGGYVRDIFLQRPSKDIDVVVVGSGIAVAEALAEAYGIKTKIHQPNRVLAWDGKARQWKEIAAVLTETFFDEEARFALVGVGINVNNRGARRETDVSLKHLIGTQTSKEILLGEVLNRFWQHYAQWLQSAC